MKCRRNQDIKRESIVNNHDEEFIEAWEKEMQEKKEETEVQFVYMWGQVFKIERKKEKKKDE